MSNNNKGRSCCLPSTGCCFGLVLLFICLLGIPAAGVYYFASGGPDPLYDDFEPSEAEARNYETAFNRAIEDAANSADGTFSLSFTDREFMSWVNLEYREQLAEQQSAGSVQDSLVFQSEFDDGVAKFYASVDLILGIQLKMLIDTTIAPAAVPTETDKFDITITSAQIGRYTADEAIESDVDEAFTEAFSERLKQLGTDYTITSVGLSDGRMMITGTITGEPTAPLPPTN